MFLYLWSHTTRMRQIRPNLYISDLRGAEQHGDSFDTVISLSLSDPSVENQHFPIEDNSGHDYEIFKSAVNAIVEALESGKLKFAAIDVFEKEPTPEVKLLMQPKLSLSPHIGGATNEAQSRIGTELAQQIIDLS